MQPLEQQDPNAVTSIAPSMETMNSINERTKVGHGMRTIGGWNVSRGGLKYYKGNAFIEIQTSPYLRIMFNDGTNNRGFFGEAA